MADLRDRRAAPRLRAALKYTDDVTQPQQPVAPAGRAHPGADRKTIRNLAVALVLVSGALVWAVAALAYVLWLSPLIAQVSGPKAYLAEGQVRATISHCAMNEDDAEVLDRGLTITFQSVAAEGGPGVHKLRCVLESFGAPDSLSAKIEQTRAVDGTLTEEWPGFTATWTYHPDHGANVIVEQTGS